MADRIGIVKALLKGATGGPHEGGIRAYHSSPHDFDKFDWSKLRTGEGANTYGAGFYFAENPKVSGQGGQYWDQFARNRFAYDPTPEGMATRALMETKADRAAAIAKLSDPKYQEHLQHFLPNSYFKDVEPKDALRLLESGQPVGPRTYEVNINARPELMLDWDKPIGQQADLVKDIAKKVGIDLEHQGQFATANYGVRNTGGDFYSDLARELNPRDYKTNQPAASKMLAEYGIPGIRYLDQGSRPNIHDAVLQKQIAALEKQPQTDFTRSLIEKHRAEQAAAPPPTYNYVVTDPSKLDIMAKYGVVGTAGGGMGVLAAQDQYGLPAEASAKAGGGI